MKKIVNKIYRKLRPNKGVTEMDVIAGYIQNGRIPWSAGYENYKWKEIKKVIQSDILFKLIKNKNLPKDYGLSLDERIVEYPWILSKLRSGSGRLLDAGSTFNFEVILDQELVKQKELSIYTFHPEPKSFNERRISYLYGDLRQLPFANQWFDEVVCQSTIEHIDMDNSIYGYDLKGIAEPRKKSYEYMNVISELVRVLKSEGTLLITFPYGKFENHGFFQQFDAEMLSKMNAELQQSGTFTLTFFRYFKDGWKLVSQTECDDSESFNPHTGVGKGNDGAAHCRGICGVNFKKA